MRHSCLAMVLVGVVLGAVGPVWGQGGEVSALLRRAEALEKAGKLQEALEVREKLVEKVKEERGANHTTTAVHLNNLAELYRALGQHGKAEPLYLRSLKIFEAQQGKDHLNVAASLNNLAMLYQAMGRYSKAEPLFKRSLEIREAKRGKDHLDVGISLNNLAELYRVMDQYGKAKPRYERSLEIFEAQLSKDHPLVATSLNNQAILYQAMGQYDRAEPLYKRSLEIREAKLGKDHPDVAQSLNNLAELYQAMGWHGKAEPFYQRGLKIWEARLGKDHILVAVSLNNLALLAQALGQYDKAEPRFKRSLKIVEAKLGKDHPDVAVSLNNLAELYVVMGQYDKAEPLFERSLEIAQTKLGKDHPWVALALNNLAFLNQALGRYSKAEPLFKRSIEIVEAKRGKDHPNVATALNNLAELYRAMSVYDKAEPLYQRSLKIGEAKRGKDHPDVATYLNNLAGLYAATGKPEKAAPLFDRARRGARRYLASVLPALSEAEKAAFFTNTAARANLAMALSLGLAEKEKAGRAALSASWLLNGKAVDQEALASGVRLVRESTDPTVGKFAQQLLAARQRLAQITFATPRAGQEKQHLQQIEELTQEEQELAKKLRRAGSNAAPPAWVDLADLRQALPRDAVLIDVARFRTFDFKAKPGKEAGPARYVAWVTPKSGAVRVIDLGPADKIDAAVKRFREAVKGAAKGIKDEGEEKAEAALREHADALSKLVLAPLLPHVGKVKHWLVSPDGNLWLLPWEALPLPDGAYAIEKYDVSYLTSGRDALPIAAANVKVSAPLVMADPDFDLDPKKARAEAKRLMGTGDEEGVQSRSGAYRLGAAQRLPGTAVEAKSVAPRLKDYCGVAPRVYLREQALEAVFKAVRHPRVVVLATHGFFLPDQEAPRDERIGPGAAKAVRKGEQPLLRCGLLLAGCNNAAKATAGDDGVLTGLEVLGANLRGCELVVLSACETGLGEVQIGEGVSGLRQAFQLAGAKAVVSTLWKVPDQQSARLTTLFFRNLGKKMGKADALRAAKMQIIGERRDDYAAAHPLFWAAFTLTGEP